ncbi:unnamed protein product [Heligmosomoides polygyrus]|uniref:CRAL-TRIO domain-containing protein n=1 Tax=Heligmosomoides polygyrus TaxID=6339 RepID=A0A3P7YBT9_HELPZ|nr:unnamed protein product [Heligmosomoides polygyrus]
MVQQVIHCSSPPRHPVEVECVRSQVSDLIHPRYDTHFNILRWLQSCEFNVPKTVYNMRKHLKWRRERHLDEDARGLQRSAPSTRRFQSSDRIGRTSIQPTEYLHQLFRNFEKIQSLLMEMEAKTGVQCSVYYIFDLEGLSFDPTLLGVLSGPFRVSWQLIGQHYREFINRFIAINTPSYINVLWAALSPFIPDHAKSRIALTGKEWRQEILELADRDCLPERYGGELPDDKFMKYREVDPVPKDVYWRPRPDYPNVATLHRISIPNLASSCHVLRYGMRFNAVLVSFSFAKSKIEVAETGMAVPKCGLPAMDLYDYHAEHTGYYYLRLTNDAAWLFPTTYKLIVLDKASGKEIPAVNQKEKWIKQGAKTK